MRARVPHAVWTSSSRPALVSSLGSFWSSNPLIRRLRSREGCSLQGWCLREYSLVPIAALFPFSLCTCAHPPKEQSWRHRRHRVEAERNFTTKPVQTQPCWHLILDATSPEHREDRFLYFVTEAKETITACSVGHSYLTGVQALSKVACAETSINHPSIAIHDVCDLSLNLRQAPLSFLCPKSMD